jgi:glycosyltransferase involved in cell wall biosynthesis
MKVLWLTSWYPSRLNKFTGDFIQRHAQATSHFCKVHLIFVKKDINLPINSINVEKNINGNLTEQIIYYNSFKTNFKILDRLISFYNYKKHYRNAVIQYFKTQGKPNYVHVHVAMYAGVVAMWIKRTWNIPYFVTEHWVGYYRECVPSIYDNSFFFRWLNKQVLKKTTLFFPVTKGLGEKVKTDFVDVSYQVIPNVVNTNIFKYTNSAPAKFRFIHISHINFQKNPEGMFAAAKLLKNRGYDFELFMLGNESDELNELANKHGLLPEVVIYKNAVPYEQVAGFIQNSSAFLLFSRFENLPCVLLEALCCGLPVISTHVGGIAEVVHDGNGILVENENIEQLADAMQKIMDNYKRYDHVKIAAEAAAKFSYTQVGGQIASFYK